MLDVIRRNSQSWVVKVIFAAIILTFVFWGANSVTTDSADVLAEVNGESIYRNDLLRDLRIEIQNIQLRNPGLGQLDDEQLNALAFQVLGNMVQRALISQEAQKLGLGVSDQEFSALVTAMPDFQDATGRFSDAIYKDRIASIGMNMGKFEEDLTTDLVVGKLQDYVTGAASIDAAEARRVFNFEMERRVVEYLPFEAADYRGKVQPGETEIIAYYSENKDLYTVPAKAELEYLSFDMEVLAAQSVISDQDIQNYYEERKASFVEPASYHARHILVSLPLTLDTTEEAVLAARQKAESLLAEIRKGKNFASVARQNSDDLQTKANGGDLGWVGKGQLAPSLDLALGELKAGEISEPIRSANGFHILNMVEARPERARSLEEVRGDILAQLKEDAACANMGKALADVDDKIITGADFETLAKDYDIRAKDSGLLELAALAPALGLEPADLAAVPDVPAGKMLPAIDLKNGFMVVKVKSYQPSFIPELDAVKSQIVDAIKDREAVKLASDAAAEAAKEIAAAEGKLPRNLERKVKEAQPTTRFIGVMELDMNRDITSAVFTAPKGQWLERVFLADDAAVLLRVKDVTAPEEREWDEVSGAYIDGLNNARKNELFSLYLAQLQKSAKIELKTDRIIGR